MTVSQAMPGRWFRFHGSKSLGYDSAFPLAKALKQRRVPFGVIYDADRFNNDSDDDWARNTISHFAKVEGELGIHPDHAVIETWVRHPSRMLPENAPGRLTNVVLRYIQQRNQ